MAGEGGAFHGSSRPRPRTQAERRDETRTALLEATVECLVTYGYANTTTGRIAELAGVSRGAQAPYFRTRAELLGAAVSYLAEKRIAAAEARFMDGPVSVEQALDLLWEEHQGPVFQAALELWVASRTDPELSVVMPEVERQVAQGITSVAEAAIGDLARRPGFADYLYFALATISGLALFQISFDSSVDALWAQARQRLADGLSELSR
jgi:AcrR family transcriptional regulator